MRFLADENFDNDILAALRQRVPDLDIIRAQDTEIYGKTDRELLAFAARERRVLLTRDKRTIPRYAYERVQAGQPMPGVVEIKPVISVGDALEDLLLLIEATRDDEWEGLVKYIPIR
jgi:hypothetical protein